VLAITGGGSPVAIGWPTDVAPAWRVSLKGAGEVLVDDATGERSTGSRRSDGSQDKALLARSLHDGTGMGPVWQAVIFIGGLMPTVLAVTGIVMWWRTRRWRGDIAHRMSARKNVEPA
jgi:uncharacterized iron-regulated membrane protein